MESLSVLVGFVAGAIVPVVVLAFQQKWQRRVAFRGEMLTQYERLFGVMEELRCEWFTFAEANAQPEAVDARFENIFDLAILGRLRMSVLQILVRDGSRKRRKHLGVIEQNLLTYVLDPPRAEGKYEPATGHQLPHAFTSSFEQRLKKADDAATFLAENLSREFRDA